MTTAFQRAQPENQPGASDDLTCIKGIGAATQRWFNDALHVYTYRDLAALSAENIEGHMKASGKIVSRTKIEAWLAQARGFATAPLADAPNMPATETWKTAATFVVVFERRASDGALRTVAQHMEADKTQVWAGVALDALSRWIADQPGVPTDAQTAPANEPPIAFSAKLQRMIAAAHQLSGSRTQPASIHSSAAPPISGEAAPIPSGAAPGEYSEKLRQAIEKSRRLARAGDH